MLREKMQVSNSPWAFQAFNSKVWYSAVYHLLFHHELRNIVNLCYYLYADSVSGHFAEVS